MDDKVSREVGIAEVAADKWVMKFVGFSSCSNNTVEYKAYLTRLATTLEIGIQHLRVVANSNLVVYQAREAFP